MQRKPFDVAVRRGGKWEKLSTERLLPGDVFSLRAPDGDAKPRNPLGYRAIEGGRNRV